MEKETSLRILNSLKVDNDSASSGNPEDHDDSDHIDTAPGETIENNQVEENKDEDNTGVVIDYLVIVNVQYKYKYFSVDIMVYLSKELDGKSLSEKTSHLWTEWTRKDVPLFDVTSIGSFIFKLCLWCLRYAFLAPSGAQGVTLSVCLSVCLSGTKCSKALNLHLSLIVLSQVSIRGQYQRSV